jgi:hypothetical protein
LTERSRSMANFFIFFRSLSSKLVVKCFLGINVLIRLGHSKINIFLDCMLIRIYA